MADIWNAFRRRWNQQAHLWDLLRQAQHPWEQEGPLRWERRPGAGWELHGATLPAERPPHPREAAERIRRR